MRYSRLRTPRGYPDLECARQSEISNLNPQFTQGEPMPTYDFRCGECRKKFTLVMPISERDRKRIKCPKCGSTKAQAIFSTFSAKTSRKS